MSSDKKQYAPIKDEDRTSELKTMHNEETIKRLQLEIEKLKFELKKAKGLPSGKIGIAFMIPGVLALIYSILKESNILAFIGLGLTFWGAIFIFIKPVRYVPSELLESTVISTYKTIDRIVKDLKFKGGEAYYIPPYPKDVYLPEHLKGLKEAVVFISGGEGGVPSIEELAKSKFIIENPNGICIVPPGIGLLNQIEKELRRDIIKLQLNELLETLPDLITGSLQLAKELEVKEEDGQIRLKITGSTYKNLYVSEENVRSVRLLGCPIISAIACSIAKVSGKIVAVKKESVSQEGDTVEVIYKLLES
jgi:hypothetical protein